MHYPGSMTLSLRRTAVVSALFVMVIAHAESSRAQPLHTERSLRIADVGLRPLLSFPDAIGVTAEVHPLGGNLAIEGGAAFSVYVSNVWTAAVKYRFVVHATETFQFSVGPGVGSHWFFERGFPIDGQLVSGFAAGEAVWWRDRMGFRLALDAGVAHPVYDEPNIGPRLGTTPMLNSSIGVAFRL